ncbi:FKBP-type peptidyl-prolyl cis-trans isomerase [Seminavis robusta]|uniref:peptidylprolyl isomerase n=1 Tax=Seminavis robusta TaxID=568900 RepID=A0A9N8HRH1_9STRA|nr:FKBP-type peptidyl-prolyl cis-trans isomerase [Seminavis robusta]|eukprot:Sro1321_g262530.1 FKBP-type peptidyl-prolyl cis-trans isomerase (311) ;mRNA; f:24812-25840
MIRFWCVLTLTALVHVLNVRESVGMIRMQFDDRPNVEHRRCQKAKVKKRHLVRLHYNASIDESSPVGTPGQEVENTRRTFSSSASTASSSASSSSPIEIIVGVGQTGWDQALVHLCVGDRANLIVNAPDAPYGIERYRDNVPRGAVVRITLEIMDTQPAPVKLRDHDSYLFSGADKNNDKQLSQREFLYYFKDKKARIGSPHYRQVLKELGDLFAELDRNGDKYLTLDEFTFHKTSVHYRTELRPKDEFDFYDDNKDGKLNKKEIEGFFKAIKRKVPMDYWKHMDKNRNGYISFEEFTKKAYHKYTTDEL